MAKEKQDQVVAADVQDGRRGVLRLRYDKAQTNYTNMVVVTTTPEEVVLNFGVNIMPPTPPSAKRQQEVNVEIGSRMIMNYPSAKRLAVTLSGILQRYEAARGAIPMQVPSTRPAAGAAPAPQAASPDA